MRDRENGDFAGCFGAKANLMDNVALFSRNGCNLCERAEDLVAIYFPKCHVFDVDADELHRQLYGIRVPVLVVGGEVVLEGPISETDVMKMAQSLRAQDEFHDDSDHK